MNLLTLSAIVHDKPSNVQFLQQRNILHNPRRCANGHPMVLQPRDNGDRWRCNMRQCRSEVPLRSMSLGSVLTVLWIIICIFVKYVPGNCYRTRLSSVAQTLLWKWTKAYSPDACRRVLPQQWVFGGGGRGGTAGRRQNALCLPFLIEVQLLCFLSFATVFGLVRPSCPTYGGLTTALIQWVQDINI